MDKDFKELTENQQKFKNFVEANKLEEILMDMLHTMSHNIIQNPIIFMIQYLSSYLTQEELLKYGINIQNHKFSPQKQNEDCLVKQQNSEPLPNQGSLNSGKSSSKKKQKKKKQLEKIVEEQVNDQQMQNIDCISKNIQQNQKISKKLLINLPEINELNNKNNLFFHCFYSKEKQSFISCKDKQTELNNTIRPIIKAAIQNQDKYDCIYACDFDAYQSFQPIFHDFIQEYFYQKNQSQFETQFLQNTIYSQYKREKNDDIDFQKISNNIQYNQFFNQFIKSFRFKLKRNLSRFSFNLCLQEQERKQVEIILSDHLSQLDFKINQLNNLSILEKDKINRQFQLLKVFYKQENIGEKNIRFSNWPQNRSIGYNEQNQILALINKDDHLELLFQNIQNQNNYNPIEKICKIFKYSQNIDSKLFVNFAFDSNYGYITVKPKYLGLGLSMKSIIEIPSDFQEQFQINLQRIPDFLTNLFQIKKVATDSIQEFQGIYVYKLQSINCILETEETFIEKLDNLIQIIFDNFPQTQEKLLYYRNQNVNQIFDPIEIEEEESPSKDYNLSKEDHQQNELWKFIEKNNCVINENCYEVFENKIQSEFLNSNLNVDVDNNNQNTKQQPDHYVIQVDQEQGSQNKYQQKNEQNSNLFSLKNLIEQLEDQNDIILQSHNLIDNSIIIARRNIGNMQFKPQMKQDDFNIINSLAQSYIKQQLVKNQNQGDWYKSTTKIYEEICFQLLKQNNFIQNRDQISNKQNTLNQQESINNDQNEFQLLDLYPIGSQIYISQNKKLKLLVNYEDQFIFIYKINKHKIQHSLVEFDSILQEFESHINEQNYKFSYSNKFGYMTVNPKFCGTGLSLVYYIKEKLNDIQISQTNSNIMDLGNNLVIQQSHIKEELASRFQINRLNFERLITFINYCNQILQESKRYLLENRIFGDKVISEEVMEFESLNQQQQLIYSLIDCFSKDFQELLIYDYQQFIKYKKFYINQLQTMLQQDDEQEKIQIQNEVLEQINQKEDQNELNKDENQQQIEFDDSYVKKNMEFKNVHQKQNQEILEQKKFRKFSQKLRPDDKLIWVNVNNINAKLNSKIKMELHRNLEGFNFPQFCGLTELNELYIKIIQGLLKRDNFNSQNDKYLQDKYTDLFSFNIVNDLSQVPNRLLPNKLKISKNSLRMDEKFKENNYLQYNLQHSSLKFYKETNDQLNVVKNQGKEQNQQLNLQNLEQNGKNQYCIINKQQNLAIWLGHDNTHIIIVLKVQIEDQYIIDELNQILNKILTIAQQDQYLYDKDFGYIQNLCANDGIKLNLNISFPQNMVRNIENICQSQGFQLNIKYDTQEGNAYRSNISVEKNRANKYQWSQQSSGIQNILQLVNLKLN